MRGILQTAKRGGRRTCHWKIDLMMVLPAGSQPIGKRSEEHTSELQSRFDLVCRLLLEKKNENNSLRRINPPGQCRTLRHRYVRLAFHAPIVQLPGELPALTHSLAAVFLLNS